MNQIKRLSSVLAAGALALVFVASGPVAAQSSASTASTVAATDQQVVSGSASQGDLQARGADMITQLRKEHAKDKVKTAKQHMQTCEAHKQGLETKFTKIVGNSQRAQDRISGILDKGIAYQQIKDVQVSGYPALLAVAQTAKSTSASSIAALKAVSPTIDCNSTTTATDVATFKVAAQDVRTNLKAYRDAAKAVLKSLETPKSTTAPAATTPSASNPRSN